MNVRTPFVAALIVSAAAALEVRADEPVDARTLMDAVWERYRTVAGEIEELEILVISSPQPDAYDASQLEALLAETPRGVVHKRAKRHTAYAPNRADKIVVRFSLPREDAGTAFLVHRAAGDGQDDQWLYLPATRGVRRVPVSNTQTFVGTNFIYEDVRGLSGERTDRYEYELAESAHEDGRPCHVIRARPKAGVTSSYSQRVLWIDRERLFPLKVEYYDSRHELWKILRNRAVAPISGDTFRAEHTEMRDLRINEATVLWVREREVVDDLPAHLFSRDALGK